jgi:hypothetical protein
MLISLAVVATALVVARDKALRRRRELLDATRGQ